MVLAAALCLKVFLPAGYMPSAGGEQIVALCSSSSADAGETVTIRIPGKHGNEGFGSAENSCAFAPLAAVAVDSTLPALVLAAALLFVFVAAILRRPLELRPVAAQIRPPSQGPPAFA